MDKRKLINLITNEWASLEYNDLICQAIAEYVQQKIAPRINVKLDGYTYYVTLEAWLTFSHVQLNLHLDLLPLLLNTPAEDIYPLMSCSFLF